MIDRRGTGDIVTSCGGHIPFCDEQYGILFEKAAEDAGLTGWNCTSGGSSDTRIWAEKGIQSVNLSAGYNYEHTSQEILDVKACRNTLKLVLSFFNNSRELQRTLRTISIKEGIALLG
ncbi:hypothetical protein [Bacillus sp. EB01]|uniref:hypothetical protein n=1 Tax=Bacillus sp. EB01 TaxID=1347086 RepID=UPI000B015213|nr:hypothetical protein [Bacillus sp. EB01]